MAGGQFNENVQDIHRLDFDKLIALAIQNNNYRQAIRWFYVKILKKLSDQKLIHWEADKTNRDYLKEIQKKPLNLAFQRLTFLFEYTYYGEFQMDKLVFEEAQIVFKNFEEELNILYL